MTEARAASDQMSQLRHSLRTPLNHVIGYAEILLEDTQDVEAIACLERILCLARASCELIGSAQADAPEQFASSDSKEMLFLKARCIADEAAVLNSGDKHDIDRIRSAANELVGLLHSEPNPKSDRSLAKVHVRGDVKPADGRVLIVDDDELNRDLLLRHLQRQGYHVEAAPDGESALLLLRQGCFDVVLLDLVMPGLDGLDVLDRIRRDTELAHVPVLMISAADDQRAIAESLQRGAEDYLLKPFDSVLLDARLRATLERKRLRDHERTRNLELERVTSALQRSNEDLQRFAYAASHDLQAPVRTVTTYLQLLQRRLGNKLTADELEMIGFAQGAARRMHDLIQDLLSYSRASTAQITTEIVHTREVINNLLADMRVMLEESGAQVSTGNLPAITGDPTGLRQILQNLFSNAIKYRRPEETVRIQVAVTEQPDSWLFAVRDNGQGIPPDYCKQIFLMFKRLHGDEIPGSGIGLATCQRIVERFGGRIWVDSEPGFGSTFFFTVPRPHAAA